MSSIESLRAFVEGYPEGGRIPRHAHDWDQLALISESAAMRLSPINMPTSTPIGIVTLNAVGRVRKKISATLGRGALLRTTSSNSRPTSRMKMTNVNRPAPSSAFLITSLST